MNSQKVKQEQMNYDQTKQTFIQKLKNYQSFNQSRNLNTFNQTVKQVNTNKFKHTTNSLNQTNKLKQTLNKRLYEQSIPGKNSIQQYKAKLYSKLDASPQTSYSLLKTKYQTQQNYFNQQFQKFINQLSHIDNKYQSHNHQQNQHSKNNYLQLDQLQKYLIATQKIHQQDISLICQKTKQIIVTTIQKGTQIIKNKHKSHLQNSLKTMTLIDNQTQLLKQGLKNQSKLSESEWCKSLDLINDELLSLNSLITQTKLQEQDRYTDMEWKIKQMQFNCEQYLQRQHKDRLQKQSRLYMVMQKLIQRVGSVNV